jgi:hypothetical protein
MENVELHLARLITKTLDMGKSQFTHTVQDRENLKYEIFEEYTSKLIKSWWMKWAEHVLIVPMREKRNSYKVLVGKPKGKRPFERSQHR